MKKKRFSLSDFEISDFKLIGIHSQQEPHKLAYLINSVLGTSFKRMVSNLELSVNGKQVGFPIFDYFNEEWDTKSYLICNKVSLEQASVVANNLFETEDLVTSEFLLKDYKRVDYLLKIDDELDIFNPQLIVEKIVKTHQISMAYTIDSSAIKHPEHLILD
ncbi:IPExxxVDY family protein [Psychroflexus montanilacus]|uniref:IPExxxVDY family protein n=1 Tax=Psychroflexus montanilacus TaxID=2873598 RepID=UPI001CC9A708|nr:IPExxxVDY family protein [Psychroflexus montanilacus]MBZ9652259.1 IPExxxVDY family protein [Psychroflexus montanilacus]